MLKIGLSVSFCVQDILRGAVAEEDVCQIIAGTKAATEEEWAEVFARYRRSYWFTNPDRGEAIARRLLAAGRIDQPRLRGKEAPLIAGGHWIDVPAA